MAGEISPENQELANQLAAYRKEAKDTALISAEHEMKNTKIHALGQGAKDAARAGGLS